MKTPFKNLDFECIAVQTVFLCLAIWLGDVQADLLHPGHVHDLLRAQPHCHEYGKVVCHRVPATV